MAASTAVAEAAPLLLTIEEVPVGATVWACPPGSSEPAVEDDQPLPPLTCLIGGVSQLGAKLYPVNTLKPSVGGSILTAGFTTAKAGVRFKPTNVFSADDAPVNTRYAVFVGGKRMLYEKGRSRDPDSWYRVSVYRLADGRFVTADHLYPFELPSDAQLIPTTEIGEGKPNRRRGKRR